MKKRLSINMSKLTIGGMEKALVDLINNSNLRKKYDIDLLITYNSTDKNYLHLLPKDINVEIIRNGSWNLFGKVIAMIKLIIKIIFPQKYDVSICYTHHHKILSILTRRQSKNSVIFIHTDLISSRTEEELNKLCKNLKYEKFPKVICVSERAKESFLKLYPNYNGEVAVANNYIDEENIIKKSKEKIELKKDKNLTFVNVSRHEDDHKKISRILESTKRLNNEKYKFNVILVGDGPDTPEYKEYVKKNKLTNVIFTGSKVNPFPYYKLADAYVFSSLYEGYGIVLNEARVLEIPLITTDVADAKLITNEGYGILCENSSEGVYLGMKQFLDEGYKIKKKFNAKKFNEKITTTIDEILEK